MPHMVFCTKYKAEMEGLDEPPFDSDFGQKVFKNVSKKAWGEWVERQKMLLNEYRLQPWTREAQEFLVEQMNEFFFGSGGELPKEYVALQPTDVDWRYPSRWPARRERLQAASRDVAQLKHAVSTAGQAHPLQTRNKSGRGSALSMRL
jgi:Fe-S cluster biosynthesis and repair protein YggX